MKANFKFLFRNWSIHFAVVWAIVNVFSMVSFFYDTSRGMMITNQDGSNLTVWQHFENNHFHLSDTLAMGLFLFLAEVNYLFLFKKVKWFLFALTTLSTGILTFIVLALINPEKIKLIGIMSGTSPVLIMAAYAFVYAIIRDYFYNIRNQKDIKLQQSKNELDALKAQLNPHFLFNSLNYLYGTALNEKAPVTADGIDKLSAMMRYTITGINETFVPLENELNFIKHYLDLQKARLPQKNNIKIAIQVQPSRQALQIAPLLLLPFIENAFKYGISIDRPCFINIKIDVTNNMLSMEARNSIINGTNELNGNNTGIKNTIKRLELLYPNGYKLVQSGNNTEYQIKLTVRLK